MKVALRPRDFIARLEKMNTYLKYFPQKRLILTS